MSSSVEPRLVWDRDGRDWPNRGASRFVRAAGLVWHVQMMGQGPVMLLVHGTGASTHSWRDLAPLLAARFTIVAPDLPGHGFTEAPPATRFSLPAMAVDLAALVASLGVRPVIVLGHSAGAAILIRMSLDGLIDVQSLISMNGALLPLFGVPATLFSPLAKAMASFEFVPRLFAGRAANPAMVERLLRNTGSRIDAAGIDFYGRLARNPGHVAGALGMMANWDLRPIERDLPRLKPKLNLIVGSNDRTISPKDSLRVRTLLRTAEIVWLPGLGHLAHEERPKEVARLVTGIAEKALDAGAVR